MSQEKNNRSYLWGGLAAFALLFTILVAADVFFCSSLTTGEGGTKKGGISGFYVDGKSMFLKRQVVRTIILYTGKTVWFKVRFQKVVVKDQRVGGINVVYLVQPSGEIEITEAVDFEDLWSKLQANPHLDLKGYLKNNVERKDGPLSTFLQSLPPQPDTP